MRAMKSMVPFRTILCGVDFSNQSRCALRYAAALARTKGATLAVVYAVDPLLSAAAAAGYSTKQIGTSARTELQRFVHMALRRSRVPTFRSIVSIGAPAAAVLATADRIAADVIVLGTHGLTGVKKAFFGSTTEAILRRSARPVLVIPRTGRPAAAWPAGPIAAAVHLADTAVDEAAAAAAVAKAYGGVLTVLHAVPSMRLPVWLRLNQRSIDRRRRTLADEWLRTQLARRHLAADVKVVVGDRAAATVAFAARSHASIVVVALPASGPIGRYVEAASAYRLVHHARCPILILRLAHTRQGGRHRMPPIRLRPVA